MNINEKFKKLVEYAKTQGSEVIVFDGVSNKVVHKNFKNEFVVHTVSFNPMGFHWGHYFNDRDSAINHYLGASRKYHKLDYIFDDDPMGILD